MERGLTRYHPTSYCKNTVLGSDEFHVPLCGGIDLATLLVIDNYDSFTYNLVQMFMAYPLDIQVHRSDKITLTQIDAMRPDYILISPGPKDPRHAGISVPLIHSYHAKVPILGVCLGMQCINEAFGGQTVRASLPMHGKTSRVHHLQKGIFQDVPSPFQVARYHSLIINPCRNEFIITAQTEDDIPMGISHPHYPLHGVQFHPESFLTEHGFQLIENFLKLGVAANDTWPVTCQAQEGAA